MSLTFLAPWALAGAALIALPIAIHLLVRQHARTLAYPSLRFLRETQLAAFRRRTIEDLGLLICRAAIIAVAAMALAGPLLHTASRTAAYASRTSRAIVVDGTIDDATLASLSAQTFKSSSFRRQAVTDSLADAVRWLNQQPPSAREIVIAGALRRGSVTEGDLAAIPQGIGVRFHLVPTPSVPDVTWPILTRRNGVLVRIDRAAHFDADATRVADGAATPVRPDLISIVAKPGDQVLADAALRAALDAGVPWSKFDQPFVIRWDAAPDPPSSAADVVMAALIDAAGGHDRFEPVAISQQQLDQWTRSPGVAIDAPMADEGDRRWLWGLALLLIALEHWLRRSRASTTVPAAETEARVA